MLRKSAVLASLRDSTYRGVRLAPSIAAALLDRLFEHPAWRFLLVPHMYASEFVASSHKLSTVG